MKVILLIISFLVISISSHAQEATSAPNIENDGVLALINHLLSENGKLKKELKALVPVGSIQAYMGKEAPGGWLICDGRLMDKINKNGEYDSLKALVGDRLPDLRDMFLRGKSDSREVGSSQDDQFQTHTHYLESWAGPNGDGSNNPHNTGYGSSGPHGEDIPTKRIDGEARHGAETRPKNIAVNYIIKF